MAHEGSFNHMKTTFFCQAKCCTIELHSSNETMEEKLGLFL